ncbi:MAG TPA: hypothetical protein VFX59_21490 [Polyangiales bacterium]|nr:hypothetical protein [Polyangiales bacterium]
MKQSRQTDLESAIERLVQEHVAALHAAASTAVERAFSMRTKGRMEAAPLARRAAGSRRPPDEVAALAERLYAAVCANPGAAMPKLASLVGASARALNRPAIQLRRAGRLRSVGQRQATRYFPMTGKTSAKS